MAQNLLRPSEPKPDSTFNPKFSSVFKDLGALRAPPGSLAPRNRSHRTFNTPLPYHTSPHRDKSHTAISRPASVATPSTPHNHPPIRTSVQDHRTRPDISHCISLLSRTAETKANRHSRRTTTTHKTIAEHAPAAGKSYPNQSQPSPSASGRGSNHLKGPTSALANAPKPFWTPDVGPRKWFEPF